MSSERGTDLAAGKLAPDFKTIADFRKENLKPLRTVCRQFTVLCRKLELFGGELLAIDGSKLRRVNSRQTNYNEKKTPATLAEIDAQIQGYLKALEESDAQEAKPPGAAEPGRVEGKDRATAGT